MRDIPRELRERIEAGGSSLAILEALLIAAETRSVTDNDILPVPRWLVRAIVAELARYFRRTPIGRGRTSNPVSRAEQDDLDLWYWRLIEEYRSPGTEALKKTAAIEAAKTALADVGHFVEAKALRESHARVEARSAEDLPRYSDAVLCVIREPARAGDLIPNPEEAPAPRKFDR